MWICVDPRIAGAKFSDGLTGAAAKRRTRDAGSSTQISSKAASASLKIKRSEVFGGGGQKGPGGQSGGRKKKESRKGARRGWKSHASFN